MSYLLVGPSFAQKTTCAYKINSIAHNYQKPDSVLEQDLSQTGLYKSQLSYEDLKPLSMRKLNKKENTLKTGDIISVENLSVGVNESFIVTYLDGQKAVLKPHFEVYESNYRSEILAYELDRLFDFNLVPVTVERMYKGKKSSIQLFMESSSEASVKEDQLNKQVVFDWLINSKDRHDENFLISKKGNVISIDNGISLTGRYLEDVNHFGENIEEINAFLSTFDGWKIIRKLKKYNNDEQFKKEVISYLGVEDAHFLFERINFLTLYAKNYKKNKMEIDIISDVLKEKNISDSDLALLLEVLDKSELELDFFINILKRILHHDKRGDSSISSGLKLLRTLENQVEGHDEIIENILKETNIGDKSYAQLMALFFERPKEKLLLLIHDLLSKNIYKHDSIIMINEILRTKIFDTKVSLEIITNIIEQHNISDKALSETIQTIISGEYLKAFDDVFYLSILNHPKALDQTQAQLAKYIMSSTLNKTNKEKYIKSLLYNKKSRHITLGTIAELLNVEKLDNSDLEFYINEIVFNIHSKNYSYREVLNLIDSKEIKLHNIDEIYKHIILNMKPEMALISRIKGSMKNQGFDIVKYEDLQEKLRKLEETF